MADRKARRWLKIGRKSAGLVAQFWMELNMATMNATILAGFRWGPASVAEDVVLSGEGGSDEEVEGGGIGLIPGVLGKQNG